MALQLGPFTRTTFSATNYRSADIKFHNRTCVKANFKDKFKAAGVGGRDGGGAGVFAVRHCEAVKSARLGRVFVDQRSSNLGLHRPQTVNRRTHSAFSQPRVSPREPQCRFQQSSFQQSRSHKCGNGGTSAERAAASSFDNGWCHRAVGRGYGAGPLFKFFG